MIEHAAADEYRLVREFALYAGSAGWTTRSLDAFCAGKGISSQERMSRWPAGIRSLGHQFNDDADRRMLSRSQALGARALSEVLIGRFEDNQVFKPAVARLARSDLFHPIDTLRRTAKSARLMWSCQDWRIGSAESAGTARVWLLAVLYSLCVLLWLLDCSAAGKPTRNAAVVTARLLGAH